MLHLARNRLAVEVGQLHARRRDGGKVAVAEEEQVASVIQDGGHVAGDEVLVLAEADDRGRTVAPGDDLVGLVGGDDRDGEDAGELA